MAQAHLIEMEELLAAERDAIVAEQVKHTHQWLIGIGYYSLFAKPRVSASQLEHQWIADLMATEGRWNA